MGSPARRVSLPRALTNAVVVAPAALGIQHIDMPLTSHRVWHAMQNAGQQR